MACPACGYMMTAFDRTCPRCQGRGITPRPVPVTSRPLPPPPASYVLPPNYVPSPARSGLPTAVKWLLGIAGVLFILFIFGISQSGKPLPPPGPETLALDARMAPYAMAPTINFIDAFGLADFVQQEHIGQVDYTVYHYRCDDGEVTAWDNHSLNIIERVDAYGTTH